jgi:hypothetical protein
MLSNDSLIFLGCDTPADPEGIQPGLHAEVLGKDAQDGLLAILVFLKPREISGELIAVEPVDDGDGLVGKDLYLTIQPPVGDSKVVFFPKFTWIYLEGNGQVHVHFLCEGKTLRVLLDPGEPVLTALEVRIEPEVTQGEVLNHISSPEERTLLLQLEDQPELFTVHVEKGATVMDVRGDENRWLDFDGIQMFDQVQCYGLRACSEDGGFHAFVILVVGPVAEPSVIDWANLQWPPLIVHTISASDPTENIYGQVWIDGYTQTIGPTPGLWAQVGYGPDGSDPEGHAGWLWVDAEFNDDVGGNDEFRGQLLPEAAGTFDYAYRYSIDGGSTWTYADLDGTGNGYEPSQAGNLTVNPASQ